MKPFALTHGGYSISLQPIKCVQLTALPVIFVAKNVKSSRKWKCFECPQKLEAKIGLMKDSILIVKVVDLSNGQIPSHLALIQHLFRSKWALCPLDKSIRLKDVKQLPTGEEPDVPDVDICVKSEGSESRSNHQTDSDLLTDGVLSKPAFQLLHPLDLSQISWNSRPVTINMTPPNFSQPPEETVSIDQLLAEKYNEALYTTKTPLSYFAKSSLSRARSLSRYSNENKVQLSKGRSEQPPHNVSSQDNGKCILLQALKHLLLPLEVLDQKYKAETIETVVATNLQFARWWNSVKTNLPITEPESTINAFISSLKFREIQLQIIVLLEILCMDDGGAAPQVSKPSSLVRRRLKKSVKKAADSISGDIPLNHQAHLDVLLDRLFIWQALSQESESQSKKASPASSSPQPDKVLDFCMEVVAPFFSSRLPEKTKKILKSATGVGTNLRALRTKSANMKEDTQMSAADNHATGNAVRKSSKTDLSLSSSLNSRASIDMSSRTASLSRGGLVATTKTMQQRRQVEMSFRASSTNLEDELKTAIRNVSKPSRINTLELSSRPLAAPSLPSKKSTAQIQVAAGPGFSTPSLKRTFTIPKYTVDITTPTKKTKYSPLQILSSSPINCMDMVPNTPTKFDDIMAGDTDDDMT